MNSAHKNKVRKENYIVIFIIGEITRELMMEDKN